MATAENQKTDTVTIEIDGQALEARPGEMIIEVADRAGIDIPRFCYHTKLSIAANCRMCLVDVEKAPKPLPACATPVADGMKVFTESRRAVDAQRGVMEFLLINHPLDCPICDQGGECELQDLAMGYGRSVSRFVERKRVVADKNLGPLIATDMTRCIHCTRCVRFLEEIAGTAELGGVGRGEHLEISTFIERNIDSELSGNVIDLCPVGALTNKPFRFTARAWEMSARPYVGTHDCLGANLYYHVRGGKIMRAVPRENEAINECWIDDRDRYSHFGLAAGDRVSAPRIRVDGQWRDCEWSEALERAREILGRAREDHGGEQLGFLVSPRATREEHFLIQSLARGLGSENVDHRLRFSDFSHPETGRARLDQPLGALSDADAVFLAGSHLRHEQPLLNQRVRSAWRRRGAAVMDLNPVAWKFPFDLSERLIVPPQLMAETLARVLAAAAEAAGKDLPDDELGRWVGQRSPEPAARKIAERLGQADRGFVIIGDTALFHPHAGLIRRLAELLSELTEVSLMVLPGPANSQGAWQAGAVPGEGGLDAAAMLAEPRRAYLLYDLEPEFDTADPQRTRRALDAADGVVAVAAFAGQDLLETAEVILPLNPVPETDGSYVNADGRRQWLKAAARGPESARPGWKILRVLGHDLGLEGFDFTSLAEVSRAADEYRPAAGEAARRPLELPGPVVAGPGDETPWRVGVVPMFATDSLVRRSRPLQQTRHAEHGFCAMHPETAARAGLEEGQQACLRQRDAEVIAPVRLDRSVPPGAIWLPSATCLSSGAGPAFGPIEVEGA